MEEMLIINKEHNHINFQSNFSYDLVLIFTAVIELFQTFNTICDNHGSPLYFCGGQTNSIIINVILIFFQV